MPETGNVVCVEDFFATIESYLNKEQVEFVRKAYDVAAEAHASQRRKSGEPYIIHPLGVATILSQLQLDELTLAAAFLHICPDIPGRCRPPPGPFSAPRSL